MLELLPVSYTHLDVYKRQVDDAAEGSPAQKEGESQAEGEIQGRAGDYRQRQSSPDGKKSHDRIRSAPLYTKMQHGQRDEPCGNCPDGFDPDVLLNRCNTKYE